jgi:hypothetical protein
MRRRTRHPVGLGLVIFLLSPIIGTAMMIYLLIRICYELRLKYDPWAYRKCSQVCRAEIGSPCYTVSGAIVNGQPDYARTPLYDEPHHARKLRTMYALAYSKAQVAK